MRTIARKNMGHETGEIETWLRNIIVLLPKIRTPITLQGQTRAICMQSTLDKWYYGCLAQLLNMSLNAPCISDVGIQDICTLDARRARARMKSPLHSTSGIGQRTHDVL